VFQTIDVVLIKNFPFVSVNPCAMIPLEGHPASLLINISTFSIWNPELELSEPEKTIVEPALIGLILFNLINSV